MRTTIRQVAERAGVSKSTVSNVLLGRDREMTPATRDAVLKAARELDYVPVQPILQNRATKTHVISLVLTDPNQVSYDFHCSNYAGVCAAALKHGYDVLTVLRPNPDWDKDQRGLRLLDRRSDGIIILSTLQEQGMTFEALARHNIPTVVCYRRDLPENLIWVDPDNRGAMFGAVTHLVEAGHTQIAHLTIDVRSRFDFGQRYHYFMEAMKALDLPCSTTNCIEVSQSVTPDIARRFVETGATAVVCAHDWLALTLWEALSQLGLRVPEDISLVGVDNLASSQARGLTTMGFSPYDVGQNAVEALLAHIHGEPAETCCRQIPVELHSRTSVRIQMEPEEKIRNTLRPVFRDGN